MAYQPFTAQFLRAWKLCALFVAGMLTACGGGGTQALPPPSVSVPELEPTPAPIQFTTNTTSTIHYLDTTGCQDFPSTDYWNRRVDVATVSSHSSSEISYAYSQYPYAPGFNSHYKYEVVSASARLYSIYSTSYHKIPANDESPWLGGWPIPSDMSTLLDTMDKVSVFLQVTSPPSDCRGWDGYEFTGSSTSYKAYSGDHVEMNKNMPPETCNGVASLCGEDLEGDLTFYELNANTGNPSGTVTHPILHAIHTEYPCSIAGTCGNPKTYSFNQTYNCRTSCARIRLRKALVARPSDPNAAALYDAMVHFGLDTSESGCCWGFYTMVRADYSGYPTSIPTAVSSFISHLRLNDFEVLTNGSW